MIEFLMSDGIFPFSVVIGFIFVLAVFELLTLLIGMSLSSILDHALPDINFDLDMAGPLGDLMAYMKIKDVPSSIVIVVFLASYAVTGVLFQGALLAILGWVMPIYLAIPLASFSCIPLFTISVRFVAFIMPKDESYAISSDTFINSVATVLSDGCTRSSPREARITDTYGKPHYVMVMPSDESAFSEGERVFIIGREEDFYVAIASKHDD